jgi:hypothetical protein
MAQTQVYNGFLYTQQPDGSWQRGEAVSQQGGPIALPSDPMRQPQLRQATNQAQASDFDAPKAAADAADKQLSVAERRRQMSEADEKRAKQQVSNAFRTDMILGAIRDARKVARQGGSTGWNSYLDGVPNTEALRLRTALEPIFGNLAFERLQQMRDESVTGGALGQVSERELDLLASTVASLNTKVDLPTFLERLDKIERNFISINLAARGLDPSSDEADSMFREYGYNGGAAAQGRGELDPEATKAGQFLPPEYQAEHQRFLRDNWGNINPEEYVRFRAALDNAFGFTPDLGGYSQFANRANELASQGVGPDSFGAIRAPDRDLSTVEQAINSAAQTSLGAAAANMGNAFGMGVPGMLAGNQDELELLREARPVSSFIGEAIGSASGSLAMGGVGRMAGGAFAKPLLADVGHSAVYGATQNPNDPLQGAAYGGGGAVAGNIVGRQIARAFPEVPGIGARRQFNEARESVPTSQELRDEAGRLYSDMRAEGLTSMPESNAEMIQRAGEILARQGRIDGSGAMNIEDGALQKGVNLLNSYADAPMNPRQAQAVRQRFSEALMSDTPAERGIARQIVNEFDDWSPRVLPGIQEANKVASRYIQGDQLQALTNKGLFRGARMKGVDEGDALRTVFGQIGENESRMAAFSPETQNAITRVAQGDPVTNTLRWAGKFGGSNPITMGGGGITGGAAFLSGADPVTSLALGAGTIAAGSGARKVASDRTVQAAEDAMLTALGGPEFEQLIQQAIKLSKARQGNFFGGLAGAASQEYQPGF